MTGASAHWLPIVALAVVALAVGFAASLAAIGFVEAVHWLNGVFPITAASRAGMAANPVMLGLATVTVPALGGIAVALVLSGFARRCRQFGPSAVIAAVTTHGPLPNLRVGGRSILAAILAIGTGAPVGQYGPMVFLGALIGNLASRIRLEVPNLGTIAMGCGVAAAISTAFNAPIAGLVFAHEVIHRHYSLRSFAPTVVSATTGYIVAYRIFEQPPLFSVQFAGVESSHEYVLFAIIGGLAACVAVAYMKLISASGALASRIPLHRVLKTGLAGLAVGLAALWIPGVLGIGFDMFRAAAIEGAMVPGELLLLLAARLILTPLCIGFGFAGGLFGPALLIGVLFGSLFWTGLGELGPLVHSSVTAYAICGMVAVAGPVIGAPLTMILIVFELTHNYDLTIAAMVAVAFSNLISSHLFGRSAYDVQLAEMGVNLAQGRERAVLASRRAIDFAAANTPRCAPDVAVAEFLADQDRDWKEVFVVSEEGKLIGTVSRAHAKGAAGVAAGQMALPAKLAFDETTTLFDAMQSLCTFDGDYVPIVDSATAELLGAVSSRSIVRAYLQVESELRDEQNAT